MINMCKKQPIENKLHDLALLLSPCHPSILDRAGERTAGQRAAGVAERMEAMDTTFRVRYLARQADSNASALFVEDGDGALYLFSGGNLQLRFDPSNGWQRVRAYFARAVLLAARRERRPPPARGAARAGRQPPGARHLRRW